MGGSLIRVRRNWPHPSKFKTPEEVWALNREPIDRLTVDNVVDLLQIVIAFFPDQVRIPKEIAPQLLKMLKTAKRRKHNKPLSFLKLYQREEKAKQAERIKKELMTGGMHFLEAEFEAGKQVGMSYDHLRDFMPHKKR
jgi:hypothetical protein